MNTDIRTNKLTFSLDRSRVSEKYDFFTIETTEKYIKDGAHILDAVSPENGIVSIRFESGRKLTVMMDHDPQNPDLLKSIIRNTEGGEKLSFTETRSKEMSDSLLLQMLFNSLSSCISPILRFNNLTGHLYCYHPGWIRHGKLKGKDEILKVPCLEIQITPDCLQKMSVRTFTSELLRNKIEFKKRRFEDYPKYVFATGRSALRRKLPDDKSSGFLLRQTKGDKTEICFLDTKDHEAFSKSKMGVLTNIVRTFNEKFDGLACIGFSGIPVSGRMDYTRRMAREEDDTVQMLLSATEIFIIDQVGDDCSRIFCQSFADLIKSKYGIITSIGKLVRKNALNICVIHNDAYYGCVEDPHDKKQEGISVQHITLEDFADSAEYALSCVIHELLIKDDLLKGEITLFDWAKTGYTQDTVFVTREKDEDAEHFYSMTVHPDGSFDIKETELSLFELNEFNDYLSVYEEADLHRENVKGIIRSEGKQIVIKDTDRFTLPESEEIQELLLAGDNRLRGRERREQLLSSCLDVKLFEKDGNLFYFAGTIGEGMRYSIPRAANIRKLEISEEGSTTDIGRLLSLMSVSFVHNGQLTVIPFPFKYLREYINSKK